MQAAAARVEGSQLQSVLRGVAFAAGLATRAGIRAAEGFARLEALVYATSEPELELEPGPDIERVVTAVFGSTVVITGAFFVGMSIADAVAERSRTRKQKRRRCHPYALMGQWYCTSSSHEAPAPATVTAPAAPPPSRRRRGRAIVEPFPPPPPRRAVAPYFDASRAIAAWLQECEAAGRDQAPHAPKEIAAAWN